MWFWADTMLVMTDWKDLMNPIGLKSPQNSWFLVVAKRPENLSAQLNYHTGLLHRILPHFLRLHY